MKNIFTLLTLLLLFSFSCKKSKGGSDLPTIIDNMPFDVQLPEGFHIAVYADSIENARSLAMGTQGTVFVGSRTAGKVYALIDEDGDFLADQKIIIADGLLQPNGIAFYDGDLYVAEINKIWKYADIESNLEHIPTPELIYDALPSETHHGWRYINIGPDFKLYVSIGAPCNVCETDHTGYATINRMNLDGSHFEVYAEGVRNTLGFQWHPVTQEMWFTENGRDLMGDDIPADELNRAPHQGMHFGYPFCHQGDILDPEFGVGKDCNDFIAPAQKLKPHAATLGLLFYTGDMFPEEYKNQIFIAEHGSWNRSEKIGYCVSLVNLENDNKTVKKYSDFATGFLDSNKSDVHGRPVDMLQLKDGSVLVSDDFSNRVYRISYH